MFQTEMAIEAKALNNTELYLSVARSDKPRALTA